MGGGGGLPLARACCLNPRLDLLILALSLLLIGGGGGGATPLGIIWGRRGLCIDALRGLGLDLLNNESEDELKVRRGESERALTRA